MMRWKFIWPIGAFCILTLVVVDFATVNKAHEEVNEYSCCLEGGHKDHANCSVHETSMTELPPGHPDISEAAMMQAPMLVDDKLQQGEPADCPYLKEHPSQDENKLMTQKISSRVVVLAAESQYESEGRNP